MASKAPFLSLLDIEQLSSRTSETLALLYPPVATGKAALLHFFPPTPKKKKNKKKIGKRTDKHAIFLAAEP